MLPYWSNSDQKEGQSEGKGSKEESWQTDQGEIRGKGKQQGRDQRRKAGRQAKVALKKKLGRGDGSKEKKIKMRGTVSLSASQLHSSIKNPCLPKLCNQKHCSPLLTEPIAAS